MKINFKNIIYAVAGGILGIMIFIPFSKNIEGADITSNILTTAGGTLNIEQFQLARKYRDRDEKKTLDFSSSVLNSDNENAIFRMVGSSMFNNFLSFGQTRFDRLFIGYPDKQERDATLSVDGAITIKSLAHDGSTEVHACVNDFGVIEACDAVAQPSYHWETGECVNVGGGVCNGSWELLVKDGYGGNYETQQCSGINPSNRDSCELQHPNCLWNPNIIKSVVCKDDNNDTVSDSYCDVISSKPSENCTVDTFNYCASGLNSCSSGSSFVDVPDISSPVWQGWYVTNVSMAIFNVWKCEDSNNNYDICSKETTQSLGHCNNAVVNKCFYGRPRDLPDTSISNIWECVNVNGVGPDGSCSKSK